MEKVEKFGEQMQYPTIALELLAMSENDQTVRRHWNETGIWEDDDVDKQHTIRLKTIIQKIGWPTISKVGEEGSHAAWLIAQHADTDTPFQEECLRLMEACTHDVDPADLAYLTDRVLVNKKLPQRYGTQFGDDTETETYGPRPIEDEVHLDERRESVGVEPFQEYKEHMLEEYKKSKALQDT